MPALAVQSVGRNGLVPTFTTHAAGATYQIVNDGTVSLLFRHTGTTTAQTVTFTTPAQVDGLAVTDPTITVAAATTHLSPTFDPDVFGTLLDVAITGGTAAEMSIAAVRINQF